MNLNELIGRVQDLERELAAFKAAVLRPPERTAEPLGGGAGISGWGILRGVPAMELSTTQKLAMTLAKPKTVRPAGSPQAGTIAEKIDEDSADINVPDDPAHGITTDDRVNVIWEGGSRYDLAVTASSATQITVEGGGGDEFPANGTDVTVQARSIRKWYLLTNDSVVRSTEPDLNAEDYVNAGLVWTGPADLDPVEDFPYLVETSEANGVMYLLPIFGSGENGIVLAHMKLEAGDAPPVDGYPETDAYVSAGGGAMVRLSEPGG